MRRIPKWPLPVLVIAALWANPGWADGEPLTRAEAAQLQRDAKQGDAGAQYDLAMAYHEGAGGLRKSDKKAVEWFRKSAEQKEARSEFNLGIACYRGIGTNKNLEEAAKWFRLAADQGNVDAQLILAAFYDKGRGGLPIDPVQSYVWLSRARAGGNDEADRDIKGLEETMTQEQLAQAKQLAGEPVGK